MLPDDLPDFLPGWVWLTGAGPGDPGLLTLHAWNALRQADQIVYDSLLDSRVLKLAKPGAGLIFAGKRGGKPSPKQRDISAKLIEMANAGYRVLRLKGGDPFVFGRGGEEGLALAAARIPFRVIPGITAGIGGLAYAGIPATHRSTNHAVAFVTGHDTTGEVPDTIDWAALAKGAPVLVLYMALKHMEGIADRLMAAGRAADEPIAFIRNATAEDQEVIETTLGQAGEAARQIKPPAIVVIGPVVSLRPSLDWLGALAGRELVVPDADRREASA
jgi:uroporphyrin-III C-methyltransferase